LLPVDFVAKPQAKTDQMYQSFMEAYVQRINAATFNVTIGGVRIGQAKYSRLAQINLKTRIITFSRYAIENVPERGRRYLVLHELAHVKEPSHNRNFWQQVGRFEPDYRKIDKELEKFFRQNVKKDSVNKSPLEILGALNNDWQPGGKSRLSLVDPAEQAAEDTCILLPGNYGSGESEDYDYDIDVFQDLENSGGISQEDLGQLHINELAHLIDT
jgi:hypothetical protein